MDGLPPTLTIDDTGRRLAGALAGNIALAADEFCALEGAAEAHGVLPLLALHGEGDRARLVLRHAAARDAVRTAGLIEALAALHGTRVRVLVLKGAHLALTFYAAPHLRPRLDTDLLLRVDARDRARQALEAIGFALVPHVRGDLILAQMHLTRESNGFLHALDVHWHALNPHAFRDLLAFDDAWARSQPIPGLGASARGLCNADAMLLATTHPAAHHPGDVRLIWIVDIDRIAAGMTTGAWSDFLRRACEGRVARVALASLMTARLLLGTAVPQDVLDALTRDDADQCVTAAYLRPATKAQRLWSEVRALNGWRTRAGYLRQHLLPDRIYMRARYGQSAIMLPWRYMTRIAFGAARWLGR